MSEVRIIIISDRHITICFQKENINRSRHTSTTIAAIMLVITLASFLLPSAAYSQIPYLPNVQSSDGLVGSGGTAATTDFAIPNPATINIITKRLSLAATHANANGGICLPQLDRFIKIEKESRFTIVKQCITVTGTVLWTNYFNEDGDANFNVRLDPQYKNMLAPGSYSQVFLNKYRGGPAMHMETVCQGPVTSTSKQNVGACDGYNGPDFKPVLPKKGQHVMVSGRYLVEFPEVPGGITELHPVYAIKILPS
ncbi:MAG TPA: hypothetical protein VIW25_07175 [Nitrososphaeraceae archaeon]